jgi:endonuclease YncB( thermonuclease family)
MSRFLFIGIFLVAQAVSAQTWEGRVTRVLDGDSFRVMQGGTTATIRLYGIDCPEYDQRSGQEAKALTKALVQGKIVSIEPMDTDRYGRIVALVQSRGRLVNGELVRNGLAWVYPRYCLAQPICRDLGHLERDARNQGLELWQEEKPVPPWLWKRRTR